MSSSLVSPLSQLVIRRITRRVRRLLGSFAYGVSAPGMTRKRTRNRPQNAHDSERGADCFHRILG
jgi:hypothetical protein